MTAFHGTRLGHSIRSGRNIGETSNNDGRVDVNNDDARQIADREGQERAVEQDDEEEDDYEKDQDEDQDQDDEDEEEDEDEDGDDDEEDDEEEEEDGVAEEEEDESPFRFLEGFDANWFTGKSLAAEPRSTSYNDPSGSNRRSPTDSADDAEFYGAMIQMLTHVLGSSDSITWPNQATPGSQLAPSPFAPPYSSPAHTPSYTTPSFPVTSRSAIGSNGASSSGSNKNKGSKSELSVLQPMIQALIARLGKDYQLPRRPVGEQDLTALLQTLMIQQQQRQQDQQANKGAKPRPTTSLADSKYDLARQGSIAQMPPGLTPQPFTGADSSYDLSTSQRPQPLHFADLDFEDEDEDDPDFNPDLNPDLPLPSAWSLAVRDVVASEESRAAAAAAAVAASQSGTPSGAQTPADMLRPDSYKAANAQATSDGRSAMPSPLGDAEGRRSSFELPSARPSRYNSFAQASTSATSASAFAPPSHSTPTQRDVRQTSTRQVTPPLSSTLAGVQADDAPRASDLLFSPSGRPIRASRKRPGSPSFASQSRQSRADVAAPLAASRREETAAAEQGPPRKRGRKPVLEPGEAQRRRAQRNVEYQRMRRQVKKAEESEQSETVLELKAEVKMLRAEMERLRDENAMLRAQRELDRLQRSNHG
ncbi:hypothetical protein EX895_006304 [Sporisorium graminicola]|uniref:BZIP domain-containing protein n=1 Tax=Sporisorium graminicola TaxID=280036 RepID=A0A4U7KM58_9BASI|nr:hypothetical protein EX895_006304 [Sporisorium graminicola]TKY85224.1 hypothetical protein EX895_006304 [Sporisorium graminicola]